MAATGGDIAAAADAELRDRSGGGVDWRRKMQLAESWWITDT